MNIVNAALLGGLVAVGTATAAYAQDYPSRPITLVVPFAAGGPADSLARLIAEPLGKKLGQQFVIENLGGAGGTLAADRVSRADPDGYTLMIYNQGFAAGPALYSNLKYNPATDFTALGLLSYGPMVLVGRKDLPPPDAKALVADLQARGMDYSFAHAGVGGVAHLCGLVMETELKLKMTEVPYKGGGALAQDLLGGQVDLYCGLWDTFDNVRAGMLKGYAVLGDTRLERIPDVPTFKELGFDNLEVYAWYGLFGPKDLPADVVSTINGALKEAMKDPKLLETLKSTGSFVFEPERQTPEAAREYLESEITRLGDYIKASGIKLD